MDVIEPRTRPRLLVHDLGRMSYADAYALQKQRQQEVIAARERADSGAGGPMHLLLVEHDPPVVTISRRPGARRHLIAGDGQLAAAGVEVAETDRGGDITYHGPGQIVAYPILDLNRLGLRLHGYMRLLEQIVIETLAQFGVAGQRDEGATGVWVRSGASADGRESAGFDGGEHDPKSSSAKICAMGVRISRWVSMHGLALNVHTNLEHFDLIVPCGLAGRSVTSMKRELGEACPTMDQVKAALAERFTAAVAAAR